MSAHLIPRNEIIESLRRIEDEVKEFHPILHSLFRKMPGIDRCHYNQGPNEMGADFILYKTDNTLIRTTHIGVIVKVGTIKQNTTEIERQIKECFIPRKGQDTNEVKIREVWVITNCEITNNAREVLTSQYSDKKIEFISGQDLASLIERFAPECLASMPPALQSFAEDSEQSLQSEDKISLIIPGMHSFYIEPNITRKVFDSYGNISKTKRLKSADELLKNLTNSPISFIEAGAGGGKSKLARELIRKIISSSDYASGKIIPTLKHAKEFKDNPLEKIREIKKYNNSIWETESQIIFIDGFDEVDIDHSERSKLVDLLSSIAITESIRIVVLTRPIDIAGITGNKVASLDVYQIEPLKGRQAISFLTKITNQTSLTSRLLKDLGSSALMRALDGSPISYILLGRLLAENEQDLPSNLTELFQKYTEIVLGRWEMAKGLRSQKEYEVLVESLTWLSQYLLDNDLPNIASAELESWINNYVNCRGISINAEQLVERVTQRNSILYLRNDNSCVGFRHRAFCEFFYARGMSRKKEIELDKSAFSPYWTNTYYFLAGIYRDCPEMILALSELELDSFENKVMRLVNFGNILLAAYLTPHPPCTNAIKKVALDTADLYISSINPQTQTPLSRLPVMQILCALSQTFYGNYGYKHFQAPLEEAIFEIESEEANEKNSIALFLLNSAYKEAGGRLLFDNMLRKYGESLPTTLKLAIHHESDRMGKASEMVKKMEKNLRKAMRSHPASSDYLNQLYKVPVAKLDKKIA